MKNDSCSFGKPFEVFQELDQPLANIRAARSRRRSRETKSRIWRPAITRVYGYFPPTSLQNAKYCHSIMRDSIVRQQAACCPAGTPTNLTERGQLTKPGDGKMAFVRRSGRVFSAAIPVICIAFVAVVAKVAASEGACGNGDLRPSCGMFAMAIALYTAVAIGGLTTLATVALALLRRKPPRLLIISSVLLAAAISSLWLPVWAAGNKLAGAVVVMLVFPLSALLALAASICSVVWLSHAISRDRRA
jgi:hypothetical protein